MTALFGGSFDPVHLGHLNAVDSLLSAVPEISRVIIMPAAVSPFKTDKSPAASAEQRLEMCRRTFADNPKCDISDHEIREEGPSYTVNTLEYLRGKYPEEKILLTLGSDSLKTLPMWYRFEDIVKLADIAAVSRSEKDSENIDRYAEEVRKLGGRVTLIRTEPFEISSSEIRRKIAENEDISLYLDKNTAEYIKEHAIYRG